MKIQPQLAKKMLPHVEADAPLDEIATIVRLPGGEFLRDWQPVDERALKGELVPSPFLDDAMKWHARRVRDMASSILREKKQVEYDVLKAALVVDEGLWRVIPNRSARDEWADESLRASVASRWFEVVKKKQGFFLKLSLEARQNEQERKFAATLASELSEMSTRINGVIPHAGEKGRYREDLLRAVLERNLPTRYHVATGFIYGCKRQLDILIYDQIDYAPLFREGGIVVVLPESVRAVIEVKTTLDKAEATDALDKIAEVSALDDCDPPFFKGIFAFDGPEKPQTSIDYILDYYRPPEDLGDNREEEADAASTEEAADTGEEAAAAGMQPDPLDIQLRRIQDPFRHLTALCVDRKHFAEVRLRPITIDEGAMLSPAIRLIGSSTDLKPQTALFVEALNEHLQVPTVKRRQPGVFRNMLKVDLRATRGTPFYTAAWGPYISATAAGYSEAEITEILMNFALNVDEWRKGEDWAGRPYEDGEI